MPTTRRQAAIEEGKIQEEKPQPATRKRSGSKAGAGATQKRKRADSTASGTAKAKTKATEGSKGEEGGEKEKEKPRSKKARVAKDDNEHKASTTGNHPSAGNRRASSVPHGTKEGEDEGRNNVYKTGTIERGHIYFFYRPKVEVEDVHSLDEVKNLHMLLIPRPPEFAAEGSSGASKPDPTRTEEAEMKVLSDGADAVPAPVTRNTSKQYHRLITIGKKKLPDAHAKGRKDTTFWGSVTSVGDDLHSLVEGLGSKTYETKTRGTRHEGAARLVARGGYALVNTDARIPSQRETHLGYNVSHPAPSELSDVQTAFGIYSASSFVVQVKNPKAPNTNPAMSHTKEPDYPDWIMKDVFGAGPGGRGRASYGLRFASVETPELLDYQGAQLLLIAARDGQQGLETSLGEGRGEALASAEDKEAHRSIMDVFKEIGLNSDTFTKDTLEGHSGRTLGLTTVIP